MARPTIFTEDTLQKLNYAFSIGCTDKEACIYADISPASLYSYQKKHKGFLERKELLSHNPVLKARIEIMKGITDNPDLALKLLERIKKDEFSPRSTVQMEVYDPIRIEYVVPAEMIDHAMDNAKK